MVTYNKYLFQSTNSQRDNNQNPLNNTANKKNKILKNSDNLGQNIGRHLLSHSKNVVFVHSKPEKKLFEPTL